MTDNDESPDASTPPDMPEQPISRTAAIILGSLGGLVFVLIGLIFDFIPTFDSPGGVAIWVCAMCVGVASWSVERNNKAWNRYRNKLGALQAAAAARGASLPDAEGRHPSAPSRPEPRLIRDVDESEELAAEWVRYMGWPAARPTVATGDNGIDVIGEEPEPGVIAAQVKFEAKKTGRPAIQGLYGAGHGVGASHWLFFSSAGYSPAAIEWADQMSIGLFRFTPDGAIEPSNATGSRYLAGQHST